MDISALQAILSTEWDLQTIALIFVIWRIDRRLFILETILKAKKGEKA